ncbi:MAG: STAS domain-containing protein [bacterium]|nr:STAS domain-containing protein [bacterium]
MEHGINISLSEREASGISDVRVDGVIDTITASELEQVIDSLVKRERFRIVIDLAGVDYISSAGWGIFISNIKLVRQNGGDIKLANMIENVREIYELLEFENVLRAYDSLDSARADFGDSKQSIKKKVPAETKLIVSEQLVTSNHARESAEQVNANGFEGEIETRILALIRRDPFSTISEVRDELNRRLTSGRVGWWTVFSTLKRSKLLRRRSRFRYARGFHQS